MSENCSHNCSSCGETCASRTMESFRVPLNPQSSVKKVIGVVSGKGGVGKSLVTSLMACKIRARNNRVGILDADITGPSIPKAFGIHGMVGVTADQLMLPRTTGPRQITGSVSCSRIRFEERISIPVEVVRGSIS